MAENLYLGQNIIVTDTQNEDKTYETLFDARDAKILAGKLEVKSDSSFSGTVIHDIGDALNSKDAANLGQVEKIVSVQKVRASGVESLIEDNIEYLNDQIEDLKTSIVYEKDRAITSENSNTDAIQLEKSRAISSENKLNDLIEDLKEKLQLEVERATKVEAQLAETLSAETQRAIKTEIDLSSALDLETKRAKDAEGEIVKLLSNLSTEVDAKIENVISSKIVEIEENTNTAILAENSRALEAESIIMSTVESETSRAKKAEFDINSALYTEITRAFNAEADISTKLDREISRAKSAESEILMRLSAVESKVQILYDNFYRPKKVST